MTNIRLLSISSCFSYLPNELVLMIWTYLGHVEAIKIFESMDCQRYIRLLEKHCYQSINFSKTSLSTFEYFCSHLLSKIQMNVRTLKLGHQASFSQLRLFTQIRSASSLSFPEMFPRLQTLILRNVHDIDDDLEPYLTIIPFIQTLTIENCSLNKLSTLICSNLLGHGKTSQLKRFNLHSYHRITFHEPIPSFYQVQYSLIYLRIYMQDFISLKNLLQFLPNLLTLDLRICSRIDRNDNDLFVSYMCPCINLTKLVLRICGIVEYFPSVVNFILLFRHNLLNLNLTFIHQDPAYHHSLVYIDGNLLFNEFLIHMIKLKNLNFCINTVCLCDQQMDSIIQSFQTDYWQSMLIGIYYDRLHHAYAIVSLPYRFYDHFVVTPDIINIQFNQIGYQLNDLSSILFSKPHSVFVQISPNEKLSSTFVNLLKQGAYRGDMIHIEPRGCYQLKDNENDLIPFNQFVLKPYEKNYKREEFIHTTMTWLNWMPHLRLLHIDTQMLSNLIPIINLCGTINQFSSLQRLVVYQRDDILKDDTLTVINQLGVSSSLQDIFVLQYKMSNDNNFISNICQICRNMHRLETMTIDFTISQSSFDCTMLDELAGTEKKNCRFECIYVSDRFIQLWIEKW